MIAVDWGTSSFRAYQLDKTGAIKGRYEAPLPLLQVPPGKFPDAFEAQVSPWLTTNTGPIVLSGMVGSRHGWLEVPYVATPAGLGEIAGGARQVAWGTHRAWIVPGISGTDESGTPDLIRGEETQILGALDELPSRALVCLPGTHSKWVRVDDRRVTSFSTHMTGELFAVLREHSILSRTMTAPPSDGDAFDDGVRRARDPGGLLHHLFGVRSRFLTGALEDEAGASYLSGLLIGHEIAANAGSEPVFLLGANAITAFYRRALDLLGRTARVLDPDSVARGLYMVAREVTRS